MKRKRRLRKLNGRCAIVDAEAQAEKVHIHAEGEAAAIFAKLEAEARGERPSGGVSARKGESGDLQELVVEDRAL